MRSYLSLIGIDHHEAFGLCVGAIPQDYCETVGRCGVITPTAENYVECRTMPLDLPKCPMDLVTSVRLTVAISQSGNESTHRATTIARPVIGGADLFDLEHSVISRPNVAGQRRGPATESVRIATRRIGWLPFAGPSGSAPLLPVSVPTDVLSEILPDCVFVSARS